MAKKYGGVIHNWSTEDVAKTFGQEKLTHLYGPNLGYVVHGWLTDDPQHRSFGGPTGFHTSLVVKINKAKTKIETLNTRYDLGEPYGKS